MVSTVNVRIAGVPSTLPAASVARTRTVCSPSLSGSVVSGVAHGVNAAVSTLHAKVAGSLALNVSSAATMFVNSSGPLSIVVSGGVVSTVKWLAAGVGSTLPAASTARTRKAWSPSRSAGTVRGDSHTAYAPLSSEHSKRSPPSTEENSNTGAVTDDNAAGSRSRCVSGGVASTVNCRCTGVGSTLPAESIARTANACAPSVKAAGVCGDWHGANGPSSIRHSKEEPGSSATNANVGSASLVNAGGPSVTVVSGGVTSAVAPARHPPGAVVNARRPSSSTAESKPRSPRSKIER